MGLTSFSPIRTKHTPLQNAFFCLLFLLPLFAHEALATLAIDPTRITFEGRSRTETVTIINQNNKPTTYRIFFTNKRMLEDGSYEELNQAQPGDLFADKLLRYSPRQVTVPAGKTQSVRLMVRKPKNLAEGEYRSHLTVEEVPEANAQDDIEAINLKEGEVGVRLIAHFAVSIPVIVRHGELHAEPTLEELNLVQQQEAASLSVRIVRTGSQSLYGDLTVIHTDANGVSNELGLLKGVAVYMPNASRIAKVALKIPQGVNLSQGQLTVTYSPSKKGGKLENQSSASSSINL